VCCYRSSAPHCWALLLFIIMHCLLFLGFSLLSVTIPHCYALLLVLGFSLLCVAMVPLGTSFDLLLLPSSLLYVALVPPCPCGLVPSIWYYPSPLLRCKRGKGNMKLKLQAQFFFKVSLKKKTFIFLVCFSLCLYVFCEYLCV
jgi:hypothetical protein